VSIAEIASVLLVTASAIVGGWIGIRVSRRAGFAAAPGKASFQRKALLVALLISVIWVSMWLTGDSLFDPSVLALGFVFSMFALVIVFRGNVRA